MSSTTAIRYERLKELETALQLKNREVEGLTQRRDALMAGTTGRNAGGRSSSSSGNKTGDDGNAGAPQQPTHPAPSAATAFERLTAKFLRKDYIQSTAAEHVGNALRQMNAATTTYRRETEVLNKSIHALGVEAAHHEREQARLAEQIDMMTQLTGLAVPRDGRSWDFADHKTPIGAHTAMLKERAKAAEAAAVAPSPSGDGGEDEGGAGDAIEREHRTKLRTFEEMRHRTVLLHKEIRTADVLKQKKGAAIRELQKTLEAKVKLHSELGEQHNAFRVLDREVREAKIALEALMRKHAQLDLQIEAERGSRDETCLAILERDRRDLAGVMGTQIERRRAQDRALKAQEFRIATLEKRLATVHKSLQDLKLDGIVAGIMADYFQLEADRVANGGSTGSRSASAQPVFQLEAPPAGAAGAAAPPTGLALPSDEELLDVDAIIPVDERVHPAIYSLFHSEKVKRERAVATQRIMLREKDDAIEALTAKVVDLTNDYDGALQRLDEAARDVLLEEDDYQQRIREGFEEQRRRYGAAVDEKLRLRRRQERAQSEEQKKRAAGAKIHATTTPSATSSAPATARAGASSDAPAPAASPAPAAAAGGGAASTPPTAARSSQGRPRNDNSPRSPSSQPRERSLFADDDAAAASFDGIENEADLRDMGRDEATAQLALCMQALDCLSKAAISELRVFRSPPMTVRLACEAMCVLLRRRTNWESCKQLLGDPRLLEMLKSVDRDAITAGTVARLKPYIDNSSFTVEQVRKASTAAGGLCQYVHAVYRYKRISEAMKRRDAKADAASAPKPAPAVEADRTEKKSDAPKPEEKPTAEQKVEPAAAAPPPPPPPPVAAAATESKVEPAPQSAEPASAGGAASAPPAAAAPPPAVEEPTAAATTQGEDKPATEAQPQPAPPATEPAATTVTDATPAATA